MSVAIVDIFRSIFQLQLLGISHCRRSQQHLHDVIIFVVIGILRDIQIIVDDDQGCERVGRRLTDCVRKIGDVA